MKYKLQSKNKYCSECGSYYNKYIICEQEPLELKNFNRPVLVNAHNKKVRIYHIIKKYSFKKSEKYYHENKFDVAILGIWSEKNYGSELTYYALYQVITNMGFMVQMIERPRDAEWKPNESAILFKTNPYPKYSLCPLYNTKYEMWDINNRFETVVIGSDQLWHRELYECFGKVCYLDFLKSNIKKISYATSFGKDEWTGNEYDKSEATYHLNKFDYISVREHSGVDLCKDKFNLFAERVLDPVFLCEQNNFLELAKKSKMKTPVEFIGVYILDNSDLKQEILNYISIKLKIELNIISDALKENITNEWNINIFKNAYIEDWLKNIITSKYVITDSFHGMCFAIIFKKQFIVIENEKRGCARFVDLLTMLGLKERLVNNMHNVERLLTTNIDYNKVDEILHNEINKSYNWLKTALIERKKVSYTADDNMLSNITEHTKKYNLHNNYLQNSLVRHEEALIKHEKAVNRHEEALIKHEEVVNRHEEALIKHEKVVNKHEISINRHEEVVNNLINQQFIQKKIIDEMNKQIIQLNNRLNEGRIRNKIKKLFKL